jgi:multisubunit Na+/H+ antiporter MnhB subunit
MGRFLPLIAIVLLAVGMVAFAAGTRWRQQREDAPPGVGFGVLLWVPVGAALAAALVAAMLAMVES